ncbi:signal peptidase I [Leptospira saintgironsiae]|uniref:Signal peptidase I n=1 Tax=Leptospira saintgironsiae TaxID=2023183 RepID=A0A2M9Y8Y2_9LEPT|nr:signal peptidase I [Leptospira saintgironsiae]
MPESIRKSIFSFLAVFSSVRFTISYILNLLLPPAGFLVLKDIRSSVVLASVVYLFPLVLLSLFRFFGEGFLSYLIFWISALGILAYPFLLFYFTRKYYFIHEEDKNFFLFFPYGKIYIFATFLIFLLVISIFGTKLVRKFWIDVYEIRSDSMEPNFQRGDLVLVQKSGFEPKRGDAILKRTEENGILPSRLIGLPRDTVSYKYSQENLPALTEINVNGIPIRSGEFNRDFVNLGENGERTNLNHSLDETNFGKTYRTIYSSESPQSVLSLFLYFPFKVITLGNDQYVALEDNRTYGIVPIFYPPLEKKDIVGKISIRIFSVNWKDSECRELEEESIPLSGHPECDLGAFQKFAKAQIRWKNIGFN